MKPRIVAREPVTIICLRYTGPYGVELGRFWQDTFMPWTAQYNLIGVARYGIAHDDPLETAPEACRYDACVEVPDDYFAPPGAFRSVIPGGEYAMLGFKGTIEHIGSAWDTLLRQWLPGYMHHNDLRPAFEYYPPNSGFDPVTGAFECELCIPVVPTY